MNEYWGNSLPKIVLRQDNTITKTINLPSPTKMLIKQAPESEIEKNYLGNTIYEEKYFRFMIYLRFEDLTEDQVDDIYSAVEWPYKIMFHPDQNADYFGIPVTVEEFEEEDIEDKTFLKAVEITLRGKDRSKSFLKGLESLLAIDEDECIMTIE